jgi:plasmid stability protein
MKTLERIWKEKRFTGYMAVNIDSRLKDSLRERATRFGRSMSKEVALRLQRSLDDFETLSDPSTSSVRNISSTSTLRAWLFGYVRLPLIESAEAAGRKLKDEVALRLEHSLKNIDFMPDPEIDCKSSDEESIE